MLALSLSHMYTHTHTHTHTHSLSLSLSRVTEACGVLTITNATEENEGTYSCRVQNDDTPQYEDVSERNENVELEFCSECLFQTVCVIHIHI